MKYLIKYKVDNKIYVNESEFLKIEIKETKNHYKLTLHPQKEIEVIKAVLDLNAKMNKDEVFYANGYQSWTDTKEEKYNQHTTRKITLGMVENMFHFKKYGDYDFTKPHKHYSFSYTYLRKDDNYRLYGSISEREGFTVFYTDSAPLKCLKQVEGLFIKDDYVLFNLFIKEGKETVFDEYFKEIGQGRTLKCLDKMVGFTTWYRHYEEVNEDAIIQDIKAIKEKNLPFKYFQIDDGYENKIGDWLVYKEKRFPKGLDSSIKLIQNNGFVPGLWLAPFVASKNSEILKEHPSWTIKNEKGEPIYQGCNWDGAYCLDIQNSEVRAYLHDVFQFYIKKGIKLFKLDFLYAACIIPTKYKSRGQLMVEAMEFLREELKDQIILGCGVPLFPAFFNVDYCRIGCDVSLKWDDLAYMRIFHRERISTKNTLVDTVSRYHIDGRGFKNDPDVILLKGTEMSQEQKDKLFETNTKYGSVLFTSDDVSKYTDEDVAKWNAIAK